MHLQIAKANTVPGLGAYTAETPEELAAQLNADLAGRAATVGLADASIAAVGGSRLFLASLTLKTANAGGTAQYPSAPGLTAYVISAETLPELIAKRAALLALPAFPLMLWLDKICGGSNGRHFWNLIIAGPTPPPP